MMEGEPNVLLDKRKNILKRSLEIQKNYSFQIPDYILDELAKAEKDTCYGNVISLIALAIINGRLSKENAIVLKNDINSKKIL